MRVAVASGLAGLAILAAPVLSERGDVGALSDRLARIVEDRMAANVVAGAVVVLIEGGAPVWTGALGMADPAADQPMTDDALFRVYEAAAIILTRVRAESSLRTWGLKLRERIGFKRAAVAFAGQTVHRTVC